MRLKTEDGPLLVVFDVDGTLVDSQHAIAAAMEAAYSAHGLPAPAHEAVRAVVGLSVAEAVALLSADAVDHPIEAIGASFKQSFAAARQADPDATWLYPGARETLDALYRRDDVLLGLATGNSRRGVTHFLDRFGFHRHFLTTQSADDAPSKPHPAMLLQAAAETGVAADKVVMIGDTSFDMAMARAAGAKAIGVSWGYHEPERLRAAGAEIVLDSFEGLHEALGLVGAEAR